MDLKKALKRTQKEKAQKNAEKANFRQKIAIFSEKS